METIGKRIQKLRMEKNLTQKELGNIIGCAQTTVAEWERNSDRIPSKKFLSRLAYTLGVSLDYLIEDEKIDSPQIPCFGEVTATSFKWQTKNSSLYHIEVPHYEYSNKRFCLKILDDLLKPIIDEGDYGIFEKIAPENGSIVILRFPKTNEAIIRKWRQQGKAVMATEINAYKAVTPLFFEVENINKLNFSKKIILEGVLVAIKRNIKTRDVEPKVNYIYS